MQASSDSLFIQERDYDVSDLQAPLYHLCTEVEAHRAKIAEHQAWLKSIDGQHSPMLVLCGEVETLKTAVAEQKAWLTSVVESQQKKIQECADDVQELSRRLDFESHERKTSLRAIQSLADLPLRCEVLQTNLDMSEAHHKIQRVQDSCISQQCVMEKQIAELSAQMRTMEGHWRRFHACKETELQHNITRRAASPGSVHRAYDILARTSPLNTSSARASPLHAAMDLPRSPSPVRISQEDLARQYMGLQGHTTPPASWGKSPQSAWIDSPSSTHSVRANGANTSRDVQRLVSASSPTRIGYTSPMTYGESITSPILR